jgi:hypothetical protein
VAISLDWGAVRLIITLEADEIGDELLVGRFSLLHDKISTFRNYAMTTLRTIFGNATQGTSAKVLLIYRKPYKADYFLNNLSEKCKHITFWKKIWTLPVAVDVPGRKILPWKGFPPYEKGVFNLSSALFHN